jgi:hypothetical protein
MAALPDYLPPKMPQGCSNAFIDRSAARKFAAVINLPFRHPYINLGRRWFQYLPTRIDLIHLFETFLQAGN